MREFVALVLVLAVLLVVDGEVDDEEEKLPTKCHGACFFLLNVTREKTWFKRSACLKHAIAGRNFSF